MKKVRFFLILTSLIISMSFKNYEISLVQEKVNQAYSTKFNGNWSSEGDVSAVGILTFELKQTKAKIEGVSKYNLNDDTQKSGLLSVNGYVKNRIAYIRFRNQKGQTVADGTLKIKGNVLTFKQTTKSFWLPKIAYTFKI